MSVKHEFIYSPANMQWKPLNQTYSTAWVKVCVFVFVYENNSQPTVFVIACTYLYLCLVLSVGSCRVSVLVWWWHTLSCCRRARPMKTVSGLANAWLALPVSLHCCIIYLQDISQQTDSLGLKRLHVIVPPSSNRAIDHFHHHYFLNVHGRWWYPDVQQKNWEKFYTFHHFLIVDWQIDRQSCGGRIGERNGWESVHRYQSFLQLSFKSI